MFTHSRCRRIGHHDRGSWVAEPQPRRCRARDEPSAVRRNGRMQLARPPPIHPLLGRCRVPKAAEPSLTTGRHFPSRLGCRLPAPRRAARPANRHLSPSRPGAEIQVVDPALKFKVRAAAATFRAWRYRDKGSRRAGPGRGCGGWPGSLKRHGTGRYVAEAPAVA
jgi:hypothetical protein